MEGSFTHFFVLYYSRPAEERRRKAILQAIEESAGANPSQPQVRRPGKLGASA